MNSGSDFLSPVYGPLSALGNAPCLVRVTVDAPPGAPAADPDAGEGSPSETPAR